MLCSKAGANQEDGLSQDGADVATPTGLSKQIKRFKAPGFFVKFDKERAPLCPPLSALGLFVEFV